MERAAGHLLADGRLHLTHGPIDLLISADGTDAAREAAFAAAARRFATVLEELVAELPALRSVGAGVRGPVARRMADAVRSHQRRCFVNPMAAVAGAVADEILAVMTAAAPLSRAIVNNGGDIALHLAPGAAAKARMALADGATAGFADIAETDGIGGIATSGRHGRSLSLGIADSVTVLARSAAAADAAATLLANAVDLPGHSAIARVPAASLDPDSDLGERLVTTGCGPLTVAEIEEALAAGLAEARIMAGEGLIAGAALFLAGRSQTFGLRLDPAQPRIRELCQE